jgi:hypothetical protein
MVKVLESSDRVLGVPQVPNVETWISVIVVRDNKLSRYEWVPHHLSLFGLDCFALGIIGL